MNRYGTISKELIRKAQVSAAEGDLIQASEKGWGAAAQAVKSGAEARGWRHDSHRALHETVVRLTRETGDEDIRRLFSLAQGLHMNFYENWMQPEEVQGNVDDIATFVARLEPVAR